MKIQPTLPPTAAPVPLAGITAGLRALVGAGSPSEKLKGELREAFGVRHVFLLSSGKAALTLILRGLRRLSSRRKVIIPAYTCYSVPSAVVKAGLEVVPCDVDPRTLDFKFGELEALLNDDVLCVLSTHLFGLPADVGTVRRLCESRRIPVVEDAAQVMGGTSNGKVLGTLGDVGFFSLARGKSISCGGGGIIVTDSSDIAPVLEEEFRSLPMESSWSAMRNLAELAATGLLIHPRLYWLPSGLPFLGLGETRFYPDFPIRRMAEARAATLTGWRRRLAAAIAIRRERARQFLLDLDEAVHGVRAITAPEASYLRLPVLVRDRQAKRILCARGAESGLGISACYPTTVHLIPELQGLLPKRQYPGASEIVDRLVTLPTHVFVQPKDRRKIRELLEQVCGSRVGGDDGLRKPGQSSSPAHAVS